MMVSSKMRNVELPRDETPGRHPAVRVPPERKEPIMITTLCAAALLAAVVFILAGCIATAAL